MGNRWGRGKGNGDEKGGVSIHTANLGLEWTGICATTKEGFQVSKRGVQGIRVGISQQRGITKRIGAALPYIMLIMYISC
jgi:hypothetical protein